MTDRELLEAAAKAAKLDDGWQHIFQYWDGPTGDNWDWSPFSDDGDSMRLAVSLKLTLFHEPSRGGWSVGGVVNGAFRSIAHEESDYRRAIVRAAAAMLVDRAVCAA